MQLKIVLFLLLSLYISSSNAGVKQDLTRYIFNEESNGVSIVIDNPEDKDLGVQVWVERVLDDKSKQPSFVGSPSFFVLGAGKKQVVRLIKVSEDMPKDMESVYWINIQEIPPKVENGLNFAINTRVKLFYRPLGLAMKRAGAEKKLSLKRIDGSFYIENTTPYVFATAGFLDENGKPIFNSDNSTLDKLSMLKPGDRIRINSTHEPKYVTFSAINDFGFIESHKISREN